MTPEQIIEAIAALDWDGYSKVRDAIEYWDNVEYSGEEAARETARDKGQHIPGEG